MYINGSAGCERLSETAVAIDSIKWLCRNLMAEGKDAENALVMAMAVGLSILDTRPFGSYENFTALCQVHGFTKESRRAGSERNDGGLDLLGREFGIGHLEGRAKLGGAPTPVFLSRVLQKTETGLCLSHIGLGPAA